MPPVIIGAALGAAGAAAGTGIALATGLTVVAAGATMASTIAAAAVMGAVAGALGGAVQMFSAPKPFRQEAKDRALSVRQAINPRQIIYGQVRTGGPIVFLHTTSDAGGVNKNKWLHMVIVLATHEVQEIGDIYFNDKVVPLGSDGFVESGEYYYTGDRGGHWQPSWERGMAYVSKHLGGAGQVADPVLVGSSEGKWTADHVGNGIAYLYVRLEWNDEIYKTGIPNITAIVKGKKVVDPRDGLTKYSNNAALCLRDYMMTPVAKGGLGVTASEFDAPNWIGAANICDETVMAEPRYTVNGTIALSAANAPKASIEAMLSAMAGSLVYAGGVFRVLPAAFRTPTFTLTERDLRGGIQFRTRTSRRENFNAVKGQFSSPEKSWQPADYPPIISETARVEDGGETIFRDIDRPFTTSSAAAQRLGKIDLLRARQPIVIDVPCQLTTMKVQTGDVINVTLARYGWAAKPFEVIGWTFAIANDGGLGIDLALREIHPSVYDYLTSENQPFDPAPGTTLPDWRNVAPPRNVSVDSSASQVQVGADGSLISRVLVTWEEAYDAFVGSYEVQWRVNGTTPWPNEIRTSSFQAAIDNAPVGTVLDVRVRAVNALGVPSNFVTITAHTVSGITDRPNPAVTDLHVVGHPAGQPGIWNSLDVSFAWTATNIGVLFDTFIVEIRDGASASGALRRTIETKNPQVSYDWSANVIDGLSRTITVVVKVRTVLGGISAPAVLFASNPAPPLPTSVDVQGGFRTVSIRYIPPPDPDWAGIRVWRSTATGFTADDASLVYDGPDTFVVLDGVPGTTYFLRFASYDAFGKVGLTVSAEQLISTVRISHSDLVEEAIGPTNLYADLQTKINGIEDAALAQLELVVQLSETEATTNAAILAEQTARATADSALASTTQQLTTTLNGHTSTLQIQAQSIDGLYGQYTVKIDNNGYVSGFGLASTTANATPSSSFQVHADSFVIAKPGVSGGDPIVPFVVNTAHVPPVMSFQGYVSVDKLTSGTLDTETLFVGGTSVIVDGPSKAIRVNDGVRDLVTIGRHVSGDYGISILDNAGNVVLSSGAGLGNGVVKSINLASGSGVNRLYNGDFQTGTDGWVASDTSAGAIIMGRNVDAGNTIPGVGLFFWTVAGTPASGSGFTVANVGQLGARYPVIPGRRYEVSGLVGQYRAAYVQILVDFYAANGSYAGNAFGNPVTVSGPFQNLGQLGQSFLFVEAPAGAATAQVRLWVQCNGGTDPYGMATHVYFGQANVNQTEPSVWVPGPTPLAVNSISGLGPLATSTDMGAARGTLGLGSLATASNVDWDAVLAKPAFTPFATLAQINQANASTYIAAAALGSAHIDRLTADKLAAGTIQTDTFLSAGNTVIIDGGNGGRLYIQHPTTFQLKAYLGHLPGVDYGFWMWDNAGAEVIGTSGITGTFIKDATIGTLKIGANQVTVPIAASLGSTLIGNSTTVGVLYISIYLSQPGLLLVSASMGHSYSSLTGFESYIYIDNALVQVRHAGNGSYMEAPSMIFSQAASAGWHSVELRWNGHGSAIHLNSADMFVLGAMR